MDNTTTHPLVSAVKEYSRCIEDPLYFINKYLRPSSVPKATIEEYNQASNEVMASKLAMETGFNFDRDHLD